MQDLPATYMLTDVLYYVLPMQGSLQFAVEMEMRGLQFAVVMGRRHLQFFCCGDGEEGSAVFLLW